MTPDSLASVLTEVNNAKGLPNAHYTSPDMFEEEKRAVLFKNWSGIGFGKDVPEIGDAKPITFIGMPLLLVRDHNGEVAVFQNTCRHRGMILVDEPTRIKGPIRCPYHSWCYDLNGALKSTPHVGGSGVNMHEDIKHEELGLFRIRSHVWHDVVFVNIDRSAPEFNVVHADLLERWKEFDQPIFHGGEASSFKLDIKTNWKLAVENYCESYHLPWIHPGLNTISRLEDHYNIEAPLAYSGQGSWVYQQIEGEGGKRFPDFDDLSSSWDSGSEYISVFPNVLFGVHRDHVFSIVIEPLATDHSIEHIELYYSQEAQSDDYADMRVQNAKLWKSVFEEDVFVVEGMQRGRKGEFFDGGKFSPVMDVPTHIFHHWVATQIQSKREQ